MQNILDKHRSDLESKLEAKSNEIMSKVIKEEKYQTLSNLHFKKIDERFESKLTNYDKKVESTLTLLNSSVLVGAAIGLYFFSKK